MISFFKNNKIIFNKIIKILLITLCILLLPLIIINSILFIKGIVFKNKVPSIFGLFPMIVLTDSMGDEFKYGDLILCKEINPIDIKVGDIISFYDPENIKVIITHRVVDINYDNLSFITKGDANDIEDKNVVGYKNLVGVYTGNKLSRLGTFAMYLQTPIGFILFIFIPLFIIVLIEILKRIFLERKYHNEKNQLLKELKLLKENKE